MACADRPASSRSDESCDGISYQVYLNSNYTIFYNATETMDWEWASWLCADTFASFHSDEDVSLFQSLREEAGLSAHAMWIGVADADQNGNWENFDGSNFDYTYVPLSI